jgi:hypothetical protein
LGHGTAVFHRSNGGIGGEILKGESDGKMRGRGGKEGEEEGRGEEGARGRKGEEEGKEGRGGGEGRERRERRRGGGGKEEEGREKRQINFTYYGNKALYWPSSGWVS